MSKTYGVAFSTSDPRTFPSLAPTFIVFKNLQTGVDVTPPGISQVATGVYAFNWAATLPIYFMMDGITVTPATNRYVFGVLDPASRIDQQLSQYSTTFAAVSSTLTALGTTNVALGTSNVALGTTNVALGTSNVALGTTAVAIGTSLASVAQTLIAIGETNVAIGLTNAAIGNTLSILDSKIGSTLSTFGSISSDPVDIYGYLKRVQEFLEGQSTFTKLSGGWDIKSRGGSLIASKTLTNTSSQVTKV
jgi:hypothetical protein